MRFALLSFTFLLLPIIAISQQPEQANGTRRPGPGTPGISAALLGDSARATSAGGGTKRKKPTYDSLNHLSQLGLTHPVKARETVVVRPIHTSNTAVIAAASDSNVIGFLGSERGFAKGARFNVNGMRSAGQASGSGGSEVVLVTGLGTNKGNGAPNGLFVIASNDSNGVENTPSLIVNPTGGDFAAGETYLGIPVNSISSSPTGELYISQDGTGSKYWLLTQGAQKFFTDFGADPGSTIYNPDSLIWQEMSSGNQISVTQNISNTKALDVGVNNTTMLSVSSTGTSVSAGALTINTSDDIAQLSAPNAGMAFNIGYGEGARSINLQVNGGGIELDNNGGTMFGKKFDFNHTDNKNIHSQYLDAVSPNIPMVDGVMLRDLNHNSVMVQEDSVRRALVGCIFTATASKTDSNSTTETSLIPTGITWTDGTNNLATFPTNFFVPGKTVRIKARGYFSTATVPGALTINVKLGSTIVTSTTPKTPAGSVSDGGWSVEAMLTCRSTGSSGTLIGEGDFHHADGTSATDWNWGMVSISPTTINTQISQMLDLTSTWATANPSNKITCAVLTIETLN